MNIQSPRLKSLLKEVFNHINTTSIDFRESNHWDELISLLPEYVEETKAYKAFCEGFSSAKLSTPYTSWAKSLQGIKAYLDTGVFYDINEDEGFILVEADITGFNLQRLIIDLKKIDYDIPTPVYKMGIKEEEFIMISLNHVHKKIKTTWFDLYY